MINTGLQQSLGTVHPSQGTTQVVPQPLASFMDAVGQISFSMSPHLFHRVQFRCIARESINMQTRLLGQKRLDIPAPVDFAAIPDHEYMTPQMMQQLTQERNNLKASDIVSMEPRVKSQPPASGRNGQDADDRYFVPPVAVSQDRGLANGSPSRSDFFYMWPDPLLPPPDFILVSLQRPLLRLLAAPIQPLVQQLPYAHGCVMLKINNASVKVGKRLNKSGGGMSIIPQTTQPSRLAGLDQHPTQ